MPLTPTKKIWMNGTLVDWDDAKIHVLNPTLHYGWGVFEGIRAYGTSRGPAVFRLTDHIARLFRSAKVYFMEPDFTEAEIVAATKEVVRSAEVESCYVRPSMYLGYGVMGTVDSFGGRDPIRCCDPGFMWTSYYHLIRGGGRATRSGRA